MVANGLVVPRLLHSPAVRAVALVFLLEGLGAAPRPAIAVELSARGIEHPVGFADIVSRVRSAVIGVRTRVEESKTAEGPDSELPFPPDSPLYRFFHHSPENKAQPRRFATALGSGFFISGDGFAVTSNHVVENGRKPEVNTDDGRTFSAKVVGADPKTDIALIKVEGSSDFPYVRLSDNRPRVGDWVIAVGNPFGLGGTVTAGIVSARGRDLGATAYDDFIQIDAPVNKGNSGGPTFDMSGEVIGVNTAIFSPSGGFIGIAFAIPSETVKAVVKQLKEKGSVTRGWIGVQIQNVTPEIADGLGLKTPEGALVSEPLPDTPATQAGIQSGDVIVSLGGEPVKDSRDLARKIASLPPGTSVELGVLRNKQDKAVQLTIGELPKSSGRAEAGPDAQRTPTEDPTLGLSLAPARRSTGGGNRGVLVTGVDPLSQAAESGIEPGDIIFDIAGKSVSTPADVRNALRAAVDGARHSVLLKIKRGTKTRFVTVPIG